MGGNQEYDSLEQIELICEQYLEAFRSGKPKLIERFLGLVPDSVREKLFREILALELSLRVDAGQSPRVSEYEPRFPQFSETVEDLFRQTVVPLDQRDTIAKAPRADNMDTAIPGRGGLGAQTSVLEEHQAFGRYRIIRQLGKGAMGAVYLAHDSQLDRSVALKTPTFIGPDGAALLDRFYREARAAATLQHANICPVFDVGEIDGTHYLTMAYIDGRTLSEVVRKKTIPERQAAAAVRKIALALAHAHSRGVVHRDLKPGNIMINRNSEPVVMDFGLARRTSSTESRATQSGQVLGTPAYMPPEQVNGELDRIGPASDIYSLGMILYELLTGQLPFRGSAAAVFVQILSQEPKRPTELRSALDPALEAICLKAISKQIESRYRSMREFAESVTDYLKQAMTSEVLSRATVVTSAPPTAPEPPSLALRPPVPPPSVRRQHTKTNSPPSHRTPISDVGNRTAGGNLWITVAGVLGLAIIAFTVFYISTNYGTVKIELNAPETLVLLDGREFRVENLDKPIRLRVGEHGYTVLRDDERVAAGKFTVNRGEETPLTISLETGGLPLPRGAIDILGRIRGRPDRAVRWVDGGKSVQIGAAQGENVCEIDPSFEPTVDYDIRLTITRRATEGSAPAWFVIRVVTPGGRQAEIYLDGLFGSGLSTIDGKNYRGNETNHVGKLFRDNIPNTVLCEVRSGRITVAINGNPIIDWRGDQSRLAPNNGTGDWLEIGCFSTVFDISEFLLIPRVPLVQATSP